MSVELSEFVIAERSTAIAGEITFVVSNVGSAEHEFIVVRTDLAPDALPLLEDGSAANEAQLEIVER